MFLYHFTNVILLVGELLLQIFFLLLRGLNTVFVFGGALGDVLFCLFECFALEPVQDSIMNTRNTRTRIQLTSCQ